MITRLRRATRARRIVLIPALAAALIAGGTATYAYFRAAGSGTGHGSTGSLLAVTVAAFTGGDAPNTTLLPGSVSADVILRVDNPNAFAVRLVAIGGDGPITGTDGAGTCTTTGVTFTPPGSPNFTINAGPGTTFVDLAGAATMGTTSDAGCQGATFSIPVSITVHKP